VHKYFASPSRDTGADLISISSLTSAILRQLFAFIGRAQNGSPPCEGFIQTQADFKEELYYQIFTEKTDSGYIEIGFNIDAPADEL
jgi:hypothetical protein